MRNDGWSDVDYHLSGDADLDARLSSLLNEACHVFYFHAGGTWKDRDKDHYASALATELALHPSLIRKLLALEDRVVGMLTYRAIELNRRP